MCVLGGCAASLTKSLIFRDFDNVLKDPLRYVHLFLLLTLLSNKNFENRHTWPVTEGPKLRCNTPPPLNEGLALINPVFLSNQFYLSETLEALSVSRIFTDRFVFYRQAFYRLVFKVVNLKDLKFLGSIFDVNIENCAKFHEVVIPRT